MWHFSSENKQTFIITNQQSERTRSAQIHDIQLNQIINAVDAKIAEEARIEAERIAAEEAEAARIEAERIEQELLSLKEKNEVNTIEPDIDPVPVNMHGE